MSNNNNKKILNVPALRFPEFDGEWKSCILGNAFNLYSGNTPDRFDKQQFTGDINWVTSGELKSHYLKDTKEKITGKASKKYNLKILSPGTFVIAIYGLEATGIRGTGSIILKNSTISQACMAFSPTKAISNEFLYCWYKKHGDIIGLKYAQGTKQQNLGSDIINNFRVDYPSINEQKKLERFISIIDFRIEIQNAIIDDLKKLRSSVIREVFCAPGDKFPQARFPGFFKEWQLVRLSDVATRISQRNDDCKCSKVLTIAAQEGLISQENFFSQRVASTNLQNYILLSKGDFAYNKSYSNGYPYGAIKRLKLYSQGIVSPIYLCFRLKSGCDSDFISYYFESTRWYRTIAEIAGEGARNHGLLNIAQNNFFNILLRLPDIKEQQLVASFIALIESKINHESIVCNAYINQKKWVLKRMFI